MLRVQHDLIFKRGIAAAEILTVVAPGGILASNFWILLPFTRGSVHLGAADKIDEPVFDPRYFLVGFDRDATIAAGKLAQRFWLSEPMSAHVQEPLSPGADVLPNNATDEQWVSYVEEDRK